MPLCSWLDPLIWVGYKRELTDEDLYAIPEDYKSQHLLERFNKSVILISAHMFLQTVYDM